MTDKIINSLIESSVQFQIATEELENLERTGRITREDAKTINDGLNKLSDLLKRSFAANGDLSKHPIEEIREA